MDAIAGLTAALSDRYRIMRELGAGGMATVYLAQDVKHDRQVAVKVLRPELAAVIGAERFLSEIKTTANLQHPHILSLFDSGTVNGTVFYVMPFVDGESLRDKLSREKQLPVDESIRIVREVADALHYAHTHGIIHRDIKPENILLQGGHALVADFGIALAASKTGGARMTETGMSLGTPQYMSPEQAMGERELDARTDVYALGCVAFETLAGEAPFTGPTAQAIVAKVVTETAPSVRSKRSTVPDHVDDAIQVALQKLPADRFRSAAEFSTALATPSAPRRAIRPAAKGDRPRRMVSWAAGSAMIAVAFVLGGRVLGGSQRSPLALGRARHVTWESGLEITPAISPDGKSVAYAAGAISNTHIMVRSVGEGRAIRLTSDSTDAETAPQWSPDGERIVFLSRGGVFSAPAGGGPARPELPGTINVPITSATWSPDGNRLAFIRSDSLLIRETDGAIRTLAVIPDVALCTWSPVNTWIACSAGNAFYSLPGALFGNVSPSRVILVRLVNGAVTPVTDSTSLNTSPTWAPDGRSLFFVSDRDGSRDIYATAIAADGHGDREPVRLSAGLGAHTISVSRTGARLTYSIYSRRSSVWSIPAPTHPPGTSAGATRILAVNQYIEVIAVSTDGKWLYYDSDLTGNSDIFRVFTTGGEPEQLTNDPTDDFSPGPSRDGKSFAFHSWRAGGSRELFVQQLDGSGVEQVTHSPDQEGVAAWSPDGRALAFSHVTGDAGVFIVRRDASGKWGVPVERGPRGFLPSWSPDGKEVAYTSWFRGGSVLIAPADSGAPRIAYDGTIPGNPLALSAHWGADGNINFATNDAQGEFSLWTINPAGGKASQLLVLDPVLHPSYRAGFAIAAGKVFFTTEDRQSDVWVMEIKQPR